MVYMKGVPEAPQCHGCSHFGGTWYSYISHRDLQLPSCVECSQCMDSVNSAKVEFKSRNVLADPELRTAIKDYSKWPTIPQVYVNGEFLGGSDILISLHRSGELDTCLKDVS